MKKLFYFGLFGLVIFEIAKMYFIMPMPGSQEMDSIKVAYFFHAYRWPIRSLFLLMVIAGSLYAFGEKKKWLPIGAIIVSAVIIYFVNAKMAADKMFLQPENITLKSKEENKLPVQQLVLGIEHNGEAKAYPIEFLTYHHQVRDNVGGKPVMITYCSVCRTGRIFEPLVDGKIENFRLVGMDHFNAMFEDETTCSWWRQVTGEAIAGPLTGKMLPELEGKQMTIEKWFELFPQGKVMQPDELFLTSYDTLLKFEQGKSEGDLTRTDSASWEDKSWVVGIKVGNASKAYDWNDLKKSRIIHDKIGNTPLVLVLSDDEKSFAAFEIPEDITFTLRNDSLISESVRYNFIGQDALNPSNKLKSIKAYQEFWHSWKTFHPNTQKFNYE